MRSTKEREADLTMTWNSASAERFCRRVTTLRGSRIWTDPIATSNVHLLPTKAEHTEMPKTLSFPKSKAGNHEPRYMAKC